MVALINMLVYLMYPISSPVTEIDICDKPKNVEQAIGCSTVNGRRVFLRYR